MSDLLQETIEVVLRDGAGDLDALDPRFGQTRAPVPGAQLVQHPIAEHDLALEKGEMQPRSDVALQVLQLAIGRFRGAGTCRLSLAAERRRGQRMGARAEKANRIA